MRKYKAAISCLALLMLVFAGCDNFFGKKTNLDFIPPSNYGARPVGYVPVQPQITGLTYPTDVIVGWDQLIYIVDAGAQKINCYDISGDFMSSYHVPGLTSVAQDRRLNLLAIGTIDTVINKKKYTLTAIYRLNLNTSLGYGLQYAQVTNTIVHPFYFTSGFNDLDSQTRFNHIAVLSDNSYYVTRTGSSNSVTQFGGPDDAVIQFSATDIFLTPVFVLTQAGQYTNYFSKPAGIASWAQPPQSTSVSSTGNFIYTSMRQGIPFSVQVIAKSETQNGIFYSLDYFPPGDTTKASGFLYTPYKFSEPTAVTVAGDGTNYMWVVDGYKDSVYQFNASGYEGVNPPPGYGSAKSIKVSFGGPGSDLTHFNHPAGVAYYNKILYVADAGNGRVLRFKLSTDFQ